MADTFVVADGDLFGHQAHDLIGYAHGDGDGDDFVLEQAFFQRGGGTLLAGGAVFVHGGATDVVPFGDVFGGF